MVSKRRLILLCSTGRSGSTMIFIARPGSMSAAPWLLLEGGYRATRCLLHLERSQNPLAVRRVQLVGHVRIACTEFGMQGPRPILGKPRPPFSQRMGAGISGMSDSPPVNALK
jgi:hypothetical protein